MTVDGQAATLSVVSRAIQLNGTACGAATVDNTDSITVNGGTRADVVTVNGSYKPGLTPEADGNSEIELTFALGAGRDTLKRNLTQAADLLTFTVAGIDIGGDGDQDLTTNTVEVIRVYGKNGNDTIDASAYAWSGVYLYGGNGDDTLIGTGANDSIRGDAGADALHGGARNDQLWGGSEDDLFFGEDGDDTLYAEGTADGADEFYGGLGLDTVTYQDRTAALTITVGNGLKDDGEVDELDLIDYDVENVTGGAGADTMTGSPETNVLSGGDGDDVIDGGAGDDTLSGNNGNDTMTGRAGNDTMGGGAGDDDLNGDVGNDTVSGNEDNDSVRGGAGDDTLHGGPGNDAVYGAGGADYCTGESGDDTFYIGGDGIAEAVDCGDGTDTVFGSGDGGTFLNCENLP